MLWNVSAAYCQRINDCQKRELMEVGVTSTYPADATLSSQYRGMQVVEEVAMGVRQLREGSGQLGPVTRWRHQQAESR